MISGGFPASPNCGLGRARARLPRTNRCMSLAFTALSDIPLHGRVFVLVGCRSHRIRFCDRPMGLPLSGYWNLLRRAQAAYTLWRRLCPVQKARAGLRAVERARHVNLRLRAIENKR